jgi:hypothetical protein
MWSARMSLRRFTYCLAWRTRNVTLVWWEQNGVPVLSCCSLIHTISNYTGCYSGSNVGQSGFLGVLNLNMQCANHGLSVLDRLLRNISKYASPPSVQTFWEMQDRSNEWYQVHWLFIFLAWGETWVHLARRPMFGLLFHPRVMDDDDDCGVFGGMNCKGNQSTWRKLSNVTLSSANSTWPDPGSNPGHRGGKPVVNRLSYGTSYAVLISRAFLFNVTLFYSIYTY